MKNDLKIVFMGTPDFAVPVLEGLISSYSVCLVVSQPDKKVGRHQEVVATPVKKVALKYGIPVFQPSKLREETEVILDLKPDLIVTCAYGQILPKEILDCPKFGAINVHASLLPKLRGGAPIHHAIIDGYRKTGVTIMYMAESLDSGDIIQQEETTILDTDNLESLHDRLSMMGKNLLLEVLPDIFAGVNKRIPQMEAEVTYARNITREEEHLNFHKTSEELFNQIRGLSPFPGAYLLLEGTEVKIYDSKKGTRHDENCVCGQIVLCDKEGIHICSQDGEIIITDLKVAGKKRMLASSYLNGVSKEKLLGKVVE